MADGDACGSSGRDDDDRGGERGGEVHLVHSPSISCMYFIKKRNSGARAVTTFSTVK
jgi:hypothetical protein